MTEDAEIKAMAVIVEALEQVDVGARARMIIWIAQRYGVEIGARKPMSTTGVDQRLGGSPQFDSFSSLFDAASPQTDAEMALVGGYWFQSVRHESDFGSQQVNDQLKNLSHGLTNVTRAFDLLKRAKPASVLQVQKSGKTKQARKRYKLTQAGIKTVEDLISSTRIEE